MSYQDWKNSVKPDKKVRKYQHVDDPLNLDMPQDFQRIIRSIENIEKHQFLPFIKREDREVRFRKDRDGKLRRTLKIRPIMYASHLDAHIYSYYNFLLSKKYESFLKSQDLDSNIIAYRKVEIAGTEKGKSNVHFAKEVFDFVKEFGECVVITQDISHFFDALNHSHLKEKMCNVFNEKQLNNNIYKVFESLTKYKYIQNKVFMESKLKKKIKQDTKAPIFKTLKGSFSINHSGKGIPQGSPISGLLANIYLVDFDLAMKASFKDIFYRRYSDDIVTVCPLGEKNEVLSFIDKKIKEQKVEINPKKTFITYLVKNGDRLEITSVTNGLNIPVGRKYVDYLGFEFDGSNVLLRKNTVQKLKYKQQKKVLKQLKNTISPKKKKKRKSSKLQKKSGRGNYFERSSAIFGDESIKQQVLRVVKKRNKLKKVARK